MSNVITALCPACYKDVKQNEAKHNPSYTEECYGEIEYGEECPYCGHRLGYFSYGRYEGLFVEQGCRK